MRRLDNFNIDTLDTSAKALAEAENQVRKLVAIVKECNATLTTEDRTVLVENVTRLKRFYEAIERNILNDN